MVLLETKNLSKSFGGLRAVWDVNVQIEKGTIHGLIGPNGSGKSTFFNLITGIYKPDSGSNINFAGQDITTQSAHQIAALGVSRTFQLLRLFLDMTVLENVMEAIIVIHHMEFFLRFSEVQKSVWRKIKFVRR